MSKCDVGRVGSSHDVELAKKSAGVRVIPARWVTAFKTHERVRARVVAKDLKSKTTGCVLPGSHGGGQLQCIGRSVERMAGSNSVFISVSVDYLKSTFEEFQVSKGTRAVPDVASHLEKMDEASLKPLSPESYSRFRKL